MDGAELVVAGQYSNKIEAELAQGALEAAEIECIVAADDAGGLQPNLLVGEGVKVLVRAEDLAEAQKILNP
jgi:hypothetical protein